MSRRASSRSRNACHVTPWARTPRTRLDRCSTGSTEANKNSGITWSDDTFKEYIKDPRAKIPGTKMVFAGIKNEKEIGDLWAYLKQFDAGGQKK